MTFYQNKSRAAPPPGGVYLSCRTLTLRCHFCISVNVRLGTFTTCRLAYVTIRQRTLRAENLTFASGGGDSPKGLRFPARRGQAVPARKATCCCPKQERKANFALSLGELFQRRQGKEELWSSATPLTWAQGSSFP